MSKFIEDVQFKWGAQRRAPVFMNKMTGLNVTEEIDQPNADTTLEYKIKAEYTQRGYAKDSHSGKTFTAIRQQFIAGLKNYVYGDVREIYLELVRAYYEADGRALEKALDKLQEEIS